MTKNLLTCLLATAAVTGSASQPAPVAVKNLDTPSASTQMKVSGLRHGDKVVGKKQLAKGVQLLTVKDAEGRTMKRILKADANRQINPFMQKAAGKAADNGTILSEDFEAWDGEDASWLPEGFASVSKSEREDAEGWLMCEPENLNMIGGVTGNSLAIEFDSEFLDEWVVFPEVTLGDDMILSLSTFNDGVWYFSMENVDFETMQYVGDKVLAFDQKIMISEDGGETWNELKSLAADFADIDSFEELLNMGTNAISKVEVSLSEYNGKKVKIAYRYVGKDGNTSTLDNIKIGYPEMEVNYSNPLGTLFFGMSPESYTLNYSVLAGPVYRPWVFINNSYADGAKYSWNFCNAEGEWEVSDEQDALEVTYHTDYTSDFTTRNNWFYTPILSGTAPGYSDGIYTRGQYLQAGGKGEFDATLQNGDKMLLNLGLGVIDPANEGYATYADALTPLFGYSPDVDNYWTSYTFGDESDENNYVRYKGFMNFFYNLDDPIVIHGMHVPAFAQLSEGAKMKAEIVLLSDEGVPSDEAYATAYCEYKDMLIQPLEQNTNDLVTLNFKFDEPVVMSSDVCMAYVVRISGFNDPDHVEYFNPLMSETENPDGYALGWIEKEIVFQGEPRNSFSPVADYTEDRCVSFYIMLEAEYPWLEGPESVNIGEGGIAEVTLDSSVEGKDLKFENMPEWLSAKAEGIHGDTKVTFQVPLTEEIKGSATVTVTAPGVSHDIIVNADGGSVAGIDAEEGDAEIYTLAGTRVSGMNAAGVYIVKDASGKVKKVIKD